MKTLMAEYKKKIPTTDPIHKHVKHGVFDLEVPGETLIAVHNALAFTLSHRDLYGEEIPICDNCMEAMSAMRRNIAQILEYANVYDKNKARLLN